MQSSLVAGCSLLLGLVGLSGCQLATPFAGPGYDPKRGVTLTGTGDTVIIGITNAVLRPFKRTAFDDYTRQVLKSLPANDGYVGHSVRSRIFGNEVWTMTVWRDEQSLDAFVRSDRHRAAIREGLAGVQKAKFLRISWPKSAALPTWNEILARLKDIEYVEYGQPTTLSSSTNRSSDQHRKESGPAE